MVVATGLRPPAKDLITNTRERILAMGGANMGKSYSFYCIARAAVLSSSDAKFYVIDTDQSFGRMVGDEEFTALWTPNMEGLINLEFKEASDWPETMKAMFEFQSKMRAQDWLMIDMISPTWNWCQESYAQRIFGKDLEEFYIQQRASMGAGDKKLKTFEGWKDYTIINEMYGKIQDRILRTPGNIYCTSEVKTLSGDALDKDLKLMFGPHGVLPVGQKRMPHLFSTILWMTSTIPGQRKIITVKDRSRQELHGMVVDDFAIDYLVDVAGWELGEPEPVTPPKPKPNPAAILALAKAKKAAAEKAAVGVNG